MATTWSAYAAFSSDTAFGKKLFLSLVVLASKTLYRLPEVNCHLDSFAGVEQQVVLLTPAGQLVYLLPICRLVAATDQTDDCGVVSIFQELHRGVPRGTVIGVQREQCR